jgi:hypothetical protein
MLLNNPDSVENFACISLAFMWSDLSDSILVMDWATLVSDRWIQASLLALIVVVHVLSHCKSGDSFHYPALTFIFLLNASSRLVSYLVFIRCACGYTSRWVSQSDGLPMLPAFSSDTHGVVPPWSPTGFNNSVRPLCVVMWILRLPLNLMLFPSGVLFQLCFQKNVFPFPSPRTLILNL